MDLKTYLEYRFRTNNHAKYQKYMSEWVNNVLNTPDGYNYEYFEIEKKHLGL